jgi:3-methyladenine DNA glycosylase AlkD
MSQLNYLRQQLQEVSSEKKAKASSWFFKTGEGQYGHGDKFIGVTVPEQRKIAKKFPDLTLVDLEKLLESDIHEERLTALFILVGKYQKANEELKKLIFEFYLTHMSGVNNWDLVDSSAHKIIGDYIKDKKITLLLSLAKSKVLWERRVAIVATFAFLALKNSKPTYAIADILLSDREDLIQKAVGWLLREAGKQVSEEELKAYLIKNYKNMGRTALRYAIEKFDDVERKRFLDGSV